MTETDRNIAFPEGETRRSISPGGEKWLGVRIPLLDHGFLYLVDYMGNDDSIVQAARVSYGMGTRATSESAGLIRYLLRHHHTTPFEMVDVKFHAKMPIFVARQWVRHRTASINEVSARYSILPQEFYIPDVNVLAGQSGSNRQGRSEVISFEQAIAVQTLLEADAERNYKTYNYLLNDDGIGNPVDPNRDMLARELARMDLTLNYYTEWYWKANLYNTLNFLRLRMDSHAQYEIRVYADAMAQIVQDLVPHTWSAFKDYTLEAVQFSGPELIIIAKYFQTLGLVLDNSAIAELAVESGMKKREREELIGKLKQLRGEK